MLPKARVSDVSKALRSGDHDALSDDIKSELRACYPQATDDEKVHFPPPNLFNNLLSIEMHLRESFCRDCLDLIRDLRASLSTSFNITASGLTRLRILLPLIRGGTLCAGSYLKL